MPKQRQREAEHHEICDDIDHPSSDDESLEVDASSRYSWYPHFPQWCALKYVTKDLRNTIRAHNETKAH